MIFVTGRTFPHSHQLGTIMGGRWNRDQKRWEYKTMMKEHRDWVKQTPGLMLVDDPTVIELAPIAQKPGYQGMQEVRHTKFYGDDKTWLAHFVASNPLVHFGFSNLAAMIDYVERIPAIITTDKRRNYGWRESDGFHGTRNMKTALQLARDGWPQGVELAETIIEKLIGQNAVARRRKHDVQGGSVNVGRMLAGNPAHMIYRPKQRGPKIVTLFCELSIDADIQIQDAMIRAGIVAAIVDILEMNGYRCEIVGVDTTLKNRLSTKVACYIAVGLKQANEPLGLNDVVFGLGHPSMVRRLGFAVMASADELINVCNLGFGSSGEAFTESFQPKRNEFYIRRIEQEYDGQLMEKVYDIWDDITEGAQLPIEIKRSE